MGGRIRHIVFLSLLFSSCSISTDSLIPEYLGKQEALLTEKHGGTSAFSLIQKIPHHSKLLREFVPVKQSAALYDYRGIKIILSVMRFKNADEAFGFVSGLTLRPRLKSKTADGGYMTYKKPCFAGAIGKFAFSFYSPTNPGNYPYFYGPEGRKIFSKISQGKSPEDKRSYHEKFLPAENRYADSLFYVAQRKFGPITVRKAYGAEYTALKKKAYIFIERHHSIDRARELHNDRAGELKNAGFTPSAFTVTHPGKGYQWKDKSRINVIYTYRWITIIITNMPDKEYVRRFIVHIFIKMRAMRNEVLKAEEKL